MDDLELAYVDRCIQRYGWQLLDHETAVRLILARRAQCAAAGVTLPVRAATLAIYSAALYRACSGAEGAARREQGFAELAQLLDRVAARRYRAVWMDVSQQALEQICRSFGRCRHEETFIAFALQQLRNAARKELRALTRAEATVSLDLDPPAVGQLHAPDDTVETVFAHDLSRDLRACLRRALERHPRATAQFMALWWSYIDCVDDKTIAGRLGRTTAAVQVLRSRALSRLRDDPGLRLLAAELGMLPAAAHAP